MEHGKPKAINNEASTKHYASEGRRRLKGGSGAWRCATTRRCKAEHPKKSHEWRKRQRKNWDEQRPAFQEWQSVDDDGVPDASMTSVGRDGWVGETDWTGGATVGCSTETQPET